MRRVLIAAALGVTLVASWVHLGAAGDTPDDPKEIIDRVDRLLRGDSSHAKVEMTVSTRRWQRTLVLEIWSKGTEKALIRIIAPKKEAGTTTLKDGPNIWNYLPKIDRTIRVPSSMMMGSWMGSHFTNDDLVKESRLVRDYNIELSFDGQRQGRRVWEFVLTPKPEAPVVWGKIIYEVDSQPLLPISARYYGEDGVLRRTLTFHDVKVMGGRRIPSRMRLKPADKPGEFTEMVYHEIEFNIPLPDRLFSLASLRR